MSTPSRVFDFLPRISSTFAIPDVDVLACFCKVEMLCLSV
jgi:hypothetical protein